VPPVVPPGRMRGQEQPILRVAPELTLRPWSPTDASVVRVAFADPDIRHWHMRELATDDEADSWITGWRERWNAETDGSWAITVVATGQVLGQTALRGVSLEFGHGQITYWVLPAFRGEGVATRAVSAVGGWAIDDLGLHRLEIHHSAANALSCRVAEKAGFALEGTMLSALLHTDGWHDMHVHALLAG
jgi:[ribosomal protein S5]-alanine N-acetyltransferase